MPDDPPVTQSGTQQGNPLNVREGQVGRLNVTRMDVATGQVKDLQVDILREIRDNTEKTGGQDKTLQESLKKMNESLRTLVGKTTPGGGEGADSVQGMLTHLVKTQQDFKALDAILKSNTLEFREWGKLVSEGIKIQRRATFREFNEQIFRVTQNLANLNKGISKVWQETKNLFEISQTGLIEVTAIFEDIAAGALKNRDALKTTVPTIVEMAERGNMLMGVLGNSAAEIATAFKANREIVEKAGIDLKRIPFEQQNEILSDLLVSQRRVGVQGDSREILQSRAAREQLEYLQQISFATGKSVKELMKMNVEERKTFEELFGLGIISKEQLDAMSLLSQGMKATGQTSIIELFTQALQEGGTELGLRKVLAASPGLMMFAGQGRNMENLLGAFETFKRTDLDKDKQTDILTQQLLNLERMAGSSIRGAAAFQEGGGLAARIMAEAFGRTPGKGGGPGGADSGFTGMAAELVKANASTGAEITGAVNALQEWLASNIGPFADLALAMGLHTAAMIAHSLAIGGSAVGSLVGKLRGRGMTLETTKQAGKRVAGMNAAKTGGRAALGTAARVGATALGGTAAVAGAGALGYLIGQEVVGPLINAAIASATGVEGATLGTTNVARGFFGAIPGLRHIEDQEQKKKIDAEVKRIREFHAKKKAQREAISKGVSPVKGINPSVGDSATVSPADAEGRKPKTTPANDPMLVQLVSQNAHLMSIVTLLTTANELGLDMIDGIGTVSSEVVAPNARRRVRGANAAAFSDFQSPGEGLE